MYLSRFFWFFSSPLFTAQETRPLSSFFRTPDEGFSAYKGTSKGAAAFVNHAGYPAAMVLMLFILLSVPMGVFCAWFAWNAWKVGRMNVVYGMSFFSFCCFATAIIVSGWAWLALNG